MDLEIFWFGIVVFFWSGYFLLEGFDFGVGMLLPFVPRSEQERSVLFRSIGPVWDGNETWLVVGSPLADDFRSQASFLPRSL